MPRGGTDFLRALSISCDNEAPMLDGYIAADAVEIKLVESESPPLSPVPDFPEDHENECASTTSINDSCVNSDLVDPSVTLPLQFERRTGLEEQTDDILSEARSAFSTTSTDHTTCDDELTRKILQDARVNGAKPGTRIRSTEEVLQLAGKVLSGSQHLSPRSRQHMKSLIGSGLSQTRKKSQLEQRSTSLDFRQFRSPSVESDSGSLVDEQHKASELPSNSSDSSMSRERGLNKIDAMDSPVSKQVSINERELHKGPEESYKFSFLDILMGNNKHEHPSDDELGQLATKAAVFAPWACGSIQTAADVVGDNIYMHRNPVSPLRSHLRQRRSLSNMGVDPRMPAWISTRNAARNEEDMSQTLPEENFYSVGTSRTVIVHEIVRGNWTWCTAWSPDGARLAIATENHHLAVIETTASTVWRVRYDRRITNPVKNNTTHTIRSIAWGSQFIAIGGTGNAVSVLAPIEPYPILHTIRGTGFVGSLSWRIDSTILAIGSREDRCIIVNVSATDDDGEGPGRHIESNLIHTIARRDWVNVVTFSPGGSVLAVGDRSGKLSVYNYEEKPNAPSKVTNITDFAFEDSILDVEWSSDGRWLYVGGEDFQITIIDTLSWEAIHRIRRDRWVQFIASSNRGSHVAVGGVESEVTILDVSNEWKPVMNIELKGLVPLSAVWHPKDQYLVLTGQDDSVIAIETTNARLIQGHCLRSISPILVVDFSPDGRFVAIGNESGVVSFFSLTGSTFVTVYEMVLASGESQSIHWSPNGQFIVIGSGDSAVIIGKSDPKKLSKIPPNTSGFSVKKVIRGLDKVHSVSIDDQSRYVAVSGNTTRILDAADSFACVREWKRGIVLANAWSPDGTWLATIGRSENLTIYDTSSDRLGQWRVIFTLQAAEAGHALAWGPTIVDGLQYLAYGGEDKKVTIIEIRTNEETWETVLEIPRSGVVRDVDWSVSGMLAVAVDDGSVTIIDLAYLQSGWAVNEMDYNWQRQGVTCFTEIRRNKGTNAMRAVRWIPAASPTHSLLAIGGTDGELEIVDLTERRRCRGFVSSIV